ncbi:hypothetical protein HELRODRAFT_138084, partial [Helobdella robusta]|uniref:Uncharacterized protein n=1 Tax=Helobdella robusta TaxID=6412 RepID=T1EIR5_HELRO
VWMFNAIFTVLVVARLAMFSEPVTQSTSKSASDYWRNRRQAEICMEREDYQEAYRKLLACLKSLERPLPTSSFNLFLSLAWNSIRQML